MKKLSNFVTSSLMPKQKPKGKLHKGIYIDQNSFFISQMFYLFVLNIHHLIYNAFKTDSSGIYISASVFLLLQITLMLLWRKRRYLASSFKIIAIFVYNWVHLEVLRAGINQKDQGFILIEALPLLVANITTIQSINYTIVRIFSMLIWLGFIIGTDFSTPITTLFPMISFMILFLFFNFTLVQRRMEGVMTIEVKLTKTIDRLKGLLNIHINDGVAVIDTQIREAFFTNKVFNKIFEIREQNDEPSRFDLRYMLNKIQVEEEGAKKDEPVYMWELLDALRENLENDTFTTTCKYQIETGEYKTYVLKVTRTNWELAKAFVLVFTDITHNNVVEEFKANEEAQDHMLDVLSRELRTPITNILGALNLIAKDLNDKSDGKENSDLKYIYICQLGCKYLQALSSTFLDVARIKERELKLNVAAFSINKVLEEIKGMYESHTIEKGLKFEVLISQDVPGKLVTDKEKLEQILLNLLSTSFKTTSAGKIMIQVRLDPVYPDSIEFCVTDTSTGIRKEDKNKLMKMFSLLGNKKVFSSDGSGLGLFISQKLVRVLAESDDTRGIRIDSIAGRGNKFTFSVTSYKTNENYFTDFHHPMLPDERDGEKDMLIPRSSHKTKTVINAPKTPHRGSKFLHRSSTPNTPNIELLIHGSEHINNDEKTQPSGIQSVNPSSVQEMISEQPEEILTPNSSRPTQKPNILIVDENPVDLMLICQQLDVMKIPYKTAINGEACLELVDEAVLMGQPFTGILIDCYMADLDGFQTTKILKRRIARKEIPYTPIIAVSAHDTQENREKAFKAGMIGWYTKPVREADLKELLEAYLKVKLFKKESRRFFEQEVRI